MEGGANQPGGPSAGAAGGDGTLPPAPGGRSIAKGSALLVATLSLACAWVLVHVGAHPAGLIGTACSVALVPLALHHESATDLGRLAYTRALAQPRVHRALAALFAALLLLACLVSSIHVSATGTEANLWTGETSGPPRYRITGDSPLRRFGIAFTRTSVLRSEEMRLATTGRLLPFLPRRYRYPADFEPRLALTIVPDGALFINFVRREYRVAVRDGSGALLAEVTLGGGTGAYALAIDGSPPPAALAARVRADQPDRDPEELAQRLARWSEYRPVALQREPRQGETLFIEVLHLTRELVLSEQIVATAPGQVVYLQ